MIPLGFPIVVSLLAGAKYAVKRDRYIHVSPAMWALIDGLEGDALKDILARIPMTEMHKQEIRIIRKRKT